MTDFPAQLDRLVAKLGLGHVDPGSLTRLTAGASQETWAFEAVRGAEAKPLILRRLGTVASELDWAIGPEVEAQLMRRARSCGVPEPEVVHILEPEDGLGRGFLSERVAGETLARRILLDEAFAEIRPRLAFMCGEAMARIHAIDIASIPSLPVKPAAKRVEELATVYRASGLRSAVFEAAFAWLRDRLPDEDHAPRLVHGDFRNGNLIIGGEGIRAVLDWELAHLGDPAEDLGWITVNSWRFGNIDRPVGGFGTVEQMLDGYRAAGGEAIAIDRIIFWRLFGSLSWGVGCRQMARPRKPGGDIAVERAMIGRRSSEAELDLLDILAPGRSR